MKYVFFFIFLALSWIFIVPLFVFTILISLWYWDDGYMDIPDRAWNEIHQKLKDTLY